MLSWLGKMFGTDAAAGKLIDTASSAVDKLWYTSEEKADAVAADNTEVRTMVVGWLAATSGQNLSRRFLAIMISLVWVSQYIYIMIINATLPFLILIVADQVKLKLLTEAARESSKSVGTMADGMTGAMMLILGFYFALPHMGKITDVAMSKFSNVFNKEQK